ncbi:MAG TPA: biotin-dependent carboxyltransferase family protein [Rhodanobacteraceae bacterium]
MTLEVLRPGLLTTLQDLGRPGFAHLGMGRAGAFDAPALRIANALCGNPATACGLEFTLLGPTLHSTADAWIAITGAPCALQVDGIARTLWTPLHVQAGQTLSIGRIQAGCRSYLAIGGGIAVEPALGSRSCDVNAHLGPLGGRPLRAGDVLPVSPTAKPHTDLQSAHWQLDPRPWFKHDPDLPLRCLPGSHFDRLSAASRNAWFRQPFTVGANSNRVGLRLAGDALALTAPVEMVSEGCVPGLVQLPPSGQPIAFGPEAPTSGGYPRIGQIAAIDLPRLAQLRPGDAVRFAPCSLDAALAALQRRERALDALEATIASRLSA